MRMTIGISRDAKIELSQYAKMILKFFRVCLEKEKKPEETRLPIVHARQIMDVLTCFANQKITLGDVKDICSTVMFEETGSQDEGIMVRDVHYPSSPHDTVYSGPHIGVATPIYQTSQENCPSHRAFDHVDLTQINEDYIQRINYTPCHDNLKFENKIPTTPWGTRFDTEYRICMRKMLNRSGERTLLPAIVSPYTTHIDGIFGVAIKENLSFVEGLKCHPCRMTFCQNCRESKLSVST